MSNTKNYIKKKQINKMDSTRLFLSRIGIIKIKENEYFEHLSILFDYFVEAMVCKNKDEEFRNKIKCELKLFLFAFIDEDLKKNLTPCLYNYTIDVYKLAIVASSARDFFETTLFSILYDERIKFHKQFVHDYYINNNRNKIRLTQRLIFEEPTKAIEDIEKESLMDLNIERQVEREIDLTIFIKECVPLFKTNVTKLIKCHINESQESIKYYDDLIKYS